MGYICNAHVKRLRVGDAFADSKEVTEMVTTTEVQTLEFRIVRQVKTDPR